MANHLRTQCRDAIVTAVTGLATTGANVFKSVVYPLAAASLPSLIVRVGPERMTGEGTLQAPRRQVRSCDFDVIAVAESAVDIDGTLIAIAMQVEAALAMPGVVGPWKTLTLVSSTPRLDGSGELPRGQLALTYRAEYRLQEGAPDVAA